MGICKANGYNGYQPTPFQHRSKQMCFLFSSSIHLFEPSKDPPRLYVTSETKPPFLFSSPRKTLHQRSYDVCVSPKRPISSLVRVVDTTVCNNVGCFLLRTIYLTVSAILRKMDRGSLYIPGESMTLATRSSPRPFRSKSLVVEA